jgi:hypothetical protein
VNATLPWDEMLAIVKRQLASAPAETDEILHDLYMAGFLAGVADCMDKDEDEEDEA